MADIAQTLADVQQLNQPGQKFEYHVEGNQIIGTWRWKDQTLFAPLSVSQDVRDFVFIVTLKDDGTYTEHTKEFSKEKHAGFQGGAINIGASANAFSGNSMHKSFSFGVGHDNQTDETGIVSASLDSTLIKTPLRDFLEAHGWKKPGLFSKFFH
jgi:hypothetical protein